MRLSLVCALTVAVLWPGSSARAQYAAGPESADPLSNAPSAGESDLPGDGSPEVLGEDRISWSSMAERDIDRFEITDIALAYAEWRDPGAFTAETGWNRRKVLDELNRHRVAAQAVVDGAANPREAVDRLNDYFFSRTNFAYKPGDAMDLVLIHKVLETRLGNELGLGMVYLAVASRLSFPWGADGRPVLGLAPRREPQPGGEEQSRLGVWGVWVPGHFFLRLQTPEYRRNIELSARGAERQDHAYLAAFDIGAREVDDPDGPRYLRTLTMKETAGILYYVAGNEQFFKKPDASFDQAAVYYGQALRLNPTLIHAYTRRGWALYRAGLLSEALPLFDRALGLVPGFPEALRVRGMILADQGRSEDALVDFDVWAGKRFGAFLGESMPGQTAPTVRTEDVESLKVRADLLEKVQRWSDASAAWRLVRALASGDKEAQAADLRLREIDARAHRQAILDRGRSYQERFRAATALGELDVPTGVRALIDVLDDPNIRFRWHCARILATLTGQETLGPDKSAWEQWWTRETVEMR